MREGGSLLFVGVALVGFLRLSGWPHTQKYTGDTKWIQEVMKRRERGESLPPWPLDSLISGTGHANYNVKVRGELNYKPRRERYLQTLGN